MNPLNLVREELNTVLRAIDPAVLTGLADHFADRTQRWFVSGQGRSRMVAGMAAMRLMHIGFETHLVGEVTAPSIGTGDALLMLSASGETPVSLHLSRRAADAGAYVLAISTKATSSLADIANHVVVVPVITTSQFGGSLFEQSSLLLLDAVVVELTHDNPGALDIMRQNHTNLE